jgi:hypothetical protein
MYVQDISLDNFQSPFRKDRVDRLGTGVAIYVKNDYHVVHRNDLEVLGVECVMKEVNWVMHPSNSSKSGSDIDEALMILKWTETMVHDLIRYRQITQKLG